MEYEARGGLSYEEYERVLEALRAWVSTHRRKNDPIIHLMGESFTPYGFLKQVEDQTEFGRSFLDYVRRQSAASEASEHPMRPHDFVDRAIQANR